MAEIMANIITWSQIAQFILLWKAENTEEL